jgi:hypothetical protein
LPGDLKTAAADAGELKLLALLALFELLEFEAEVFAAVPATGATLASGRCDILAKASGEMATISTPSAVSRVDKTNASPPTCSRTSLSASVVVAAMILWGAI